jgi:branched-chain amino acid aminotransferase
VVVDGYAFKLDQHVGRLFRSARAVKIEIGKTPKEVRDLVVETVKRNGFRDAYVKIILTRGEGSKPLLGRGEVPHPSLVIFAVPPVWIIPEESIERGAKLQSTTIKRNHPESLDPRIKSLNYLPNVLMRREAAERGMDESICYGFDGYVAEGGGENIWIVMERTLITPGHGVLEGITRETVFEIAHDLGYVAISGNIGKYDLYTADEIFLSSTAGGIIPVTEVDGRIVGTGRPGPITMELRRKYQQMLKEGSHATPIFA